MGPQGLKCILVLTAEFFGCQGHRLAFGLTAPRGAIYISPVDPSLFYKFLAEHAIVYERCDHPPVYTVEEAARLVPPLPGAKTKNLFLRDKPGRRHFRVCVPAAKQVDLKGLSAVIGASRLSFGSADRLMRIS
jgi:hypothetical protein